MRISHKRLTIWKTTFSVLLPIYGHKCWKKSSKTGRPNWTTSEPAVAVIFQKSYLQYTEHRTIRISSLRITPVDLPYAPILLNETFITALWDPGVEKSFISEEVYRKYFSYRSRQKTKDRVATAQGAPCCHLGWVELQIWIREFQKNWEFHILNNMQYQCILGIDFMKESKLTLDIDQKSLIIPDDQIKQLI
ncbi:uncharacterized protein TNCV_838471 [Trichonephila clavipes]|nr:uncharacterized protein TNCV_838471 [Trichonephila clavipes]